MSNTATVFNIQHFSLNDGPGIRTVVFFKGCPLNCLWCHNPEGKAAYKELSFLSDKCTLCKKCKSVCENSVHSFNNWQHTLDRTNCNLCGKCVKACLVSALEIIGREYTLEEIMSEISKDDIFFGENGGVTFSGGEPFMQFEGLYELLKLCKQKNYSTCIETSGFTSKENILKAAKYTDYFLFDCKITDDKLYEKYVGVDNKSILDNLSALNSIDANIVLRCPIIPNVNDNKSHFEKIAELTKKYKSIKSVEFMPYHPLGIAKSEQIGKVPPFADNSFADKEKIEKLVFEIKDIISVPIKIN